MPARERLLRVAALRPGALRVALVLTLLTPATVAAQRLERADAAYEEGRLVEAGRAYEEALASGELEASGLVRAHLRLGVLAVLGAEEDRAARHFSAALALAPDVDAPPELDPEAAADFEALRRARSGERLRAVMETSDASEPVRVTVRGAPPGLVREVEVRGRGGFSRRFSWRGEALVVDAPAAARPLSVRALDAQGNALARAGSPPPEEPEGAVELEGPAEPGDEPSLIESPWLWVAVGVVVLGVGLAVGFSASGERFVIDAPVVR